ncbi:hypothetical protein ABS784_08835 [Geobacillus sp. G4]|uniref:hypothetical protein n=1 Tax=Geobacillus TaxID=129337 RepID=UPI0004041B0C|nr:MULTISPECIES: hypothetical protein [Geobacillus thermoleovorans group]UPT59231.1 hypothetical protein GK107_07045 [Geobacillus thermoleovorans]
MSVISAKGTNDTEAVGAEHASIHRLLERFAVIDWLSSLGEQGDEQVEQRLRQFADFFGIRRLEIRWLAKEELASFVGALRLEDDDIWKVLRHVPDQLKQQAEQTGRLEALLALADEVPALIFQHSFDPIFAALSPYGNNVVTTAVGYMMYIGGMACAWEMLSDLEGWKTNPFLSLISVLERGHWPLGGVNGQFVVI